MTGGSPITCPGIYTAEHPIWDLAHIGWEIQEHTPSPKRGPAQLYRQTTHHGAAPTTRARQLCWPLAHLSPFRSRSSSQCACPPLVLGLLNPGMP
jgi:hypothetical protein